MRLCFQRKAPPPRMKTLVGIEEPLGSNPEQHKKSPLFQESLTTGDPNGWPHKKEPAGQAGGSALTPVRLMIPANALMAYNNLTGHILLATRKRV